MRATLQVKTEHDVALRPCRPVPDYVIGKEIGYREKTHDESRKQDCRRFPSREKQHGLGFSLNVVAFVPCPLAGCGGQNQAALSSLTGSPLARTSLTMPRICRTRTPSAISTSIWSSSTTFVTLATRPPLVTTVSPRR